jgi:hypothetical protein
VRTPATSRAAIAKSLFPKNRKGGLNLNATGIARAGIV